jgi:hypothetical protein
VLRAVQPEAAEAAAEVAPHAEAAAPRALVEAAAELPALVGAAAALRAWQREAAAAAQALPEAVRPSAAASVCRQDPFLPWPALRRQARFARATPSWRIASR